MGRAGAASFRGQSLMVPTQSTNHASGSQVLRGMMNAVVPVTNTMSRGSDVCRSGSFGTDAQLNSGLSLTANAPTRVTTQNAIAVPGES